MFSVYDFLNYATSLDCVRVRIFDFTIEDVIWDSNMYPDDDIFHEIAFSGFDTCEVESYDVYVDHGQACLDLNIEMDWDEEDD